MNIYIASPLGNENVDIKEKRGNLSKAIEFLRSKGYDVYVPIEHPLEHAWDWPNDEWGLQVFRNDINAITECDFMVVLNYGRLETSGGTIFEQGFAYGIGKKVLLVEMTDNVQSLMVANGRYATVKGLEGLKKYDFDSDNPPRSRVDTEQK